MTTAIPNFATRGFAKVRAPPQVKLICKTRSIESLHQDTPHTHNLMQSGPCTRLVLLRASHSVCPFVPPFLSLRGEGAGR